MTFQERFWSKVDVRDPNDCWLWIASKTTHGYGFFRSRSSNLGAHRVAYELTTACEIPPGVLLCHRCDTPACCNPSHLFEGSQADNMRDASRKGRIVSLNGEAKGAARGNGKLDAATVALIRASTASHRSLARQFNIARGYVSHIRAGRRWSHTMPRDDN